MIRSLKKDTITQAGKWGFVICAFMIFSFRADYRLNIAGLLVHPYLIVLPLAYFFSGFKLNQIPAKVLVPLGLFFLLFSLASLRNESPQSEIFKVGASFATFLFFAYAVQSERDFSSMSWGMLLLAVIIGVQGFLAGEETEGGGRLAGINVLEGLGNKNAQSLFTLPGVFLGAYLLINAIAMRHVVKISILIACLFFIIISIFLSANRSGWLGLGIIFLSMFFVMGLKGRTIVIAVVMLVIGYIAIDRFAEDIFEHKRKQTSEGYKSDEGRKMLMIESFSVGLENPIIGAGADELHRQMAVRLHVDRFGVTKMDTHFLPGYLIGATGVVSFILFFLFLYRLFFRGPKKINSIREVRQGRTMIMFFVILFVVRSIFSREILYSPTFIGGLGIVFGYYLLQLRNAYFLTRG